MQCRNELSLVQRSHELDVFVNLNPKVLTPHQSQHISPFSYTAVDSTPNDAEARKLKDRKT